MELLQHQMEMYVTVFVQLAIQEHIVKIVWNLFLNPLINALIINQYYSR